MALVAARDAAAERAVSADARPLVTPGMAKAGFVAESPVFYEEVPTIVAELE